MGLGFTGREFVVKERLLKCSNKFCFLNNNKELYYFILWTFIILKGVLSI